MTTTDKGAAHSTPTLTRRAAVHWPVSKGRTISDYRKKNKKTEEMLHFETSQKRKVRTLKNVNRTNSSLYSKTRKAEAPSHTNPVHGFLNLAKWKFLKLLHWDREKSLDKKSWLILWVLGECNIIGCPPPNMYRTLHFRDIRSAPKREGIFTPSFHRRGEWGWEEAGHLPGHQSPVGWEQMQAPGPSSEPRGPPAPRTGCGWAVTGVGAGQTCIDSAGLWSHSFSGGN